MAKDRKKLQHIHSSIPDKQPTPATLEVGEIAVNNAQDQEFLSIKNSDDKVVRFSSDGQIIEWIERKEVMPYSGFTRGADGPSGAIGPDSVKRSDLLENKSNVIIKLNQVAADKTVRHDLVNGAKDIYGLDVNPTTDYGVTDGAGFAIDMSRYAMMDANPSFSALTVTDQSKLQGNTFIENGTGTGKYANTNTGHTLTITTTDVVDTNTNWTETITNKKSTVTTETDKITTLNESATTRTTVVGTENLHVSGTTTETHDGNVTITNKANVAENTSGTTTIDRKGNVYENNQGTYTLVTSGATTETKIGNVTENHSGTTVENKKGDVTENNLANKTENTTSSSTVNVAGNYTGNTTGTTTELKIGNVTESHSGTTTENKKGNVTENNLSNKVENTSGNSTVNVAGNYTGNTTGTTTEIKVGNVTESHSGTTTENKKGDVTENNLANKTENTTGNVVEKTTGTTDITRTGNVTESNGGTTTITRTGAVTETNKTNVTVNTSGTTTVNNSGKTTVNVTAGTEINSCSSTTINTDKFNVIECNEGSGNTHIKSCQGIKLESKNISLVDGDCGPGEITIETDDLCLVGETKATLYGDSTNVGIDCDNTPIATNTRVFGKGTLISTNLSDSGKTAAQNNIEAYAAGNIIEHADGSVGITANNGITAVSSESGITITANKDICETAGGNANFYGKGNTNIGVDCAGTKGSATTIYGTTTEISGNTTSVTGATKLNLSGNTVEQRALSAKSTSNSAYTSATTATTVIGTANTSATTADYSGNTLNSHIKSVTHSGDTLAITESASTTIKSPAITGSGSTLVIDESTSISAKTPTTYLSGTTLDIKETNTTISSCTKVEVDTDNFTVNACTTGSTTFNACNGFSVNSDNVQIKQCGNNGSILIQEKAAEISGTTLVVDEGTSISAKTPTTYVSGSTLDVKESNTTISSCTSVGVNTDDFTLKQCGNSGNVLIQEKAVKVSGATLVVDEGTSISAKTPTTYVSGSTLDVKETDTTVSGNTLVIDESTSVSAKTPTTNISGTTLEIIETNTDIESCGRISAKTNSFTVQECTTGTVTINESTVNVSGTTLEIKEKNVNISASTETNISGGSLSSVTTGTTTIQAGDDVCISADDSARFYGKGSTYVGVNCNNTAASSTTVEGTTLNLSGSTTNISGSTTITSNAPTNNIIGDNVCISGVTKTSVYGKETNIGMPCDKTSSATTINISGATINEGGTTNNNTFTTINNSATTINNSGATINNKTDNFNISGNTNITGSTKITVDLTVGGDTYMSGNTYFNNTCAEIDANELSDAICEIMERGAVTIERESNPSNSGLSAVYKFYQNGAQITNSGGSAIEIDVPKDGFLKDVQLVEVNNKYYLRFTWNIFDADTQTYTTGSTDVDVENLVKDIEHNNTQTNNRGVTTAVWYNSTTGKMNVSADSVINLATTTGTAGSSRTSGTHTLSASTLTFVAGEFTPDSYNPHGSSKTIKIPTSPGDVGLGETLTYTHNGFTGTYNGGTAISFEAPHSALTLTYGATSGKTGSVSYNTSADASVSIPTEITHLNRGKLTLQKNSTTIGTYDPASDKTINMTFGGLKLCYSGTSNVCDLSGTCVDYDTTMAQNVIIPVNVSQLGRATLKYEYGSTTGKTSADNGTYDPGEYTVCSGKVSDTIVIPTSASDIGLGKNLTLTYGSTCNVTETGVTYNGSTTTGLTIPKTVSDTSCGHIVENNGAVTISANSLSSYTTGNTTIKTTGTTTISGSNTVEISAYGQGHALDLNGYIVDVDGYGVSISGSTGVTVETDGTVYLRGKKDASSSQKTVSWDGDNLAVDGKITATGAIYSSDKRLKENINYISEKAAVDSRYIRFREFNFKDDESKRKTYGVIAQEVLNAGFDELVYEKEDGMLGVDYISLLILKNQRYENEISQLTTEILRLIKRVSELEKKINNNSGNEEKKD